MKTIDLNELEHWADEERSFALMDVLPEKPGGQGPLHNPPPMLGFLDQIAHLNIDKVHPVVLYEKQSAVVATTEAEGALEDAGFHNVYHFVGPHAVTRASEHASEAN